MTVYRFRRNTRVRLPFHLAARVVGAVIYTRCGIEMYAADVVHEDSAKVAGPKICRRCRKEASA